MKKSISFIVLAVILLFSSFGTVRAQTSIGPPQFIWEKRTSIEHGIFSFTVLPGNRYVAGYYNYYSPDHRLVCYDSNGNIVWQKGLWAKPLSNSIITLESENTFAVTLNDSVYKFDYNGNVISGFHVPTNGQRLSIFKDHDYYAVIEKETLQNLTLFLYDHNWSFLRSFPVRGDVGSAAISGDEIYLASSYPIDGVQSNMSSRFSKYNLTTGAEIFSLLLPDLFDARLCLGDDGNVYFAAARLSSQAPQQFWEVKKFDAIGTLLWSKNWLGDLPGQPILGLWVKDIVSLGNEGCLVLGAATKLNQGASFDVNNQDPICIAFKPEGEINWKYRHVSLFGCFIRAKLDNNSNLIAVCFINSAQIRSFMKFSLPGLTAVSDPANPTPSSFRLDQNYPNPFNPSTTISFSVEEGGPVSLKVYDLLGAEVAVPVNEDLSPGNYQYTFLASGDLPSGTYFYRLEARKSSLVRKMLLLK